MGWSVKLSAIVSTHNRPDALRRCLGTLQNQDVSPDTLEVVVVDDGSTVDIDEVVADVAACGPVAMRCEHQELAGLNTARNRGAAVAAGEVLAFLDDDTLVSPEWAGALLAAFGDHPCAAVGGKVDLGLPGPAPDWLAGHAFYLAQYDLGPTARWIDTADPVPVGANCAVRRSDFEAAGGFRSGLDRIGSSLVSNGDTEFFRRLRAGGGRLRYEPRAQVTHCVPADRLTIRYFAKRSFAQGVSDERLGAAEGERFSWGLRVNHARLAARGAKMLCTDLMRRRRTPRGWFELHYWAGRAWAHRPRSSTV